MRVRAAIYLDFDNLVSGLIDIDPRAGLKVIQNPSVWLESLAVRHQLDGPRAWLVRRCYMNPSGSVDNPLKPGERLRFSRLRPFYTRAGFDVIDCPSLTNRGKNAADIRIALDVMDAMNGPTHYDEFVIASSDADFTPLLQRLRAADRRTTLISTFSIAGAFQAMADQHLDAQDVFELLAVDDGQLIQAPEEPPVPNATPAPPPSVPAEVQARFRQLVTEHYGTATSPINLARFSTTVRTALGPVVGETNWFGTGGFTRALALLQLPEVQFSQHYMWDGSRHEAPSVTGAQLPDDLPEAVTWYCLAADLPRLDSSTWARVFSTLASYLATHRFNLTESTRWSRDELAAAGFEVGRTALAFVVQGAKHGGCSFDAVPAPTEQEIARAFLNNILNRGRSAGLQTEPADAEILADWLGVNDFQPQPPDVTEGVEVEPVEMESEAEAGGAVDQPEGSTGEPT